MTGREPELLAFIRGAVLRSPSAALHFVADDGTAESVTLADFVGAAEALSLRLRAAGLGRGDLIAIRGAGGARSVAEAILACVMNASVAAPLVSLLGDSDIDAVLRHSNAVALLSDAAVKSRDLTPLLDNVIDRGAPRVVGGIGALAADERYQLPIAAEPPPAVDWTGIADTDPAFVLFSSGTTGVPKGALHSYASVLAEVLDFADQLDLVETGVGLEPFPLGHVGGLAAMFIALCLGRETVVLSSWDARIAFDAIERFGVTGTGSTPYMAQTLFEECERRGTRPESLRTMESGGGFVGRELVYRADALGIRLSRGYGSTEHPTVCTHHSTDSVELRAESDGRPVNGSEVKVVDAGGRELTPGAEGEILVRGPEQFIGYLSGDRSALDDEGWFRTGDLGRVDEAGYVTITGRLKEVIIRGGENISVAEVEAVLLQHQDIAEVAVVAVPDARFGERAHAYVVRAHGARPIDVDEVRRHFAALQVAQFKVPEFVSVIDALPRNALGKVQKHLLKQRQPRTGSPTTVETDGEHQSTTMSVLTVASCQIRYRRLGSPGNPRIVLLHGGRAHGGWWARVAPQLARSYHVLIPDLSGFCASGHRSTYTPQLWADEVAALIAHDGGSHAHVVGHSMGGLVGVYVAARHPSLVRTLTLVDTPIRPAIPFRAAADGRPRRLNRRYPSQEEAVAGFRLVPPGTIADAALLREVAREGLVSVDGQWTWAFDPAARRRFTDDEVERQLDAVRSPVGAVYGCHSTLVDQSTVDYLRTRLGQPVPAVAIPEAHHHVPLDTPHECAQAIATVLEDMDRSRPTWNASGRFEA